MPKIITLFNHKGGVGKTTVAHNLAVSLTKQRKNVLLIDADPQMNLTSSVLGLADNVEYAEKNESIWNKVRKEYTKITTYLDDYIKKDIKLTPSLVKLYTYEPEKQNHLFEKNNRGKLNLLLGDIQLFELESLLSSIVTSKASRGDTTVYSIEKAIRELGKDHDYIIIDTSPSASSILNGVLVMMSDYFLCPVFPNFFSLQAIDNLYAVLKNWIFLLDDFKVNSNYQGLSFEPKFLGIIVSSLKRYENEIGNTDKLITKYAVQWKNSLNKSIFNFYKEIYEGPTKRTVTESEFVKIFPDRKPFVIEEICDFTGQIKNVAEKSGFPVVDLNNQIVTETAKRTGIRDFKITKVNNKSKDTPYQKSFSGVIKSYNFIAECIAKNI
jgi:chromosome partitioning protein